MSNLRATIISSNKTDKKNLQIAFIHPDLGIGGAERLVVDAAVGLQEVGHNVTAYTNHCDLSHCFEEVKNGTLKVEVYGDSLPISFFGKFFIIFANIRQLYLVFQLIRTGKIKEYDLFIVDQLSTCIPLLHYFSNAKVMYYCHFPDQLLAKRTSLLKKLYRIPFDLLEQMTISVADSVVVNSKFTRSMYKKTFNYLKHKEEPGVIYPCVDLTPLPIESYDRDLLQVILNPHDKFYLSINRYEIKKNIELALKGFALSSERNNDNAKLIICGGYDERVTENVIYHKQLEKIAGDLELSHATIFYPEFKKQKSLHDFKVSNCKVIFLTSISSSLKELLLEKTEMLLYTPTNEHFGIVPLEAMKYGKPVLAANSGGPLETVISYVEGKNNKTATGWQRNPDPKLWAEAIEEYLEIKNGKLVDFTKNGPRKVNEEFIRPAMTDSFEKYFSQFMNTKRAIYLWEKLIPAVCVLLLLSIPVIISRLMFF
ncbi:hypothetical protein TBLA_0B05350 [Henningerozyma blattae CBS 6284]|uniref:Alpha-1,3/1,6-mannosyltransferase ALG2 n=1 Tax=Henningerozyma blattae (strain ATCC 34711 / CBS 6284 / DSM 70876 / NBRC 10599 / NRRL Y-10934 / UCD 77-7) TaxID=1071380 RepID=I2GZ15_HENB6|nr:hypothetical protein TBLA_0B05350 [Tetrapisispora blattae CBS 6284]CCH59367.1 hypothetical protein TBLA_0B05350 [Tetrapisispora blattae CBS 6284]